jgi:hypothetical protein
MPDATFRVQLYRLDEADAAEMKGPCSLCGERSKKWPREWGVDVLYLNEPPHEDNPMRYSACGRCRHTLRELAEICFGDSLHGVLEFQGDAPYYPG